MIAVNLFNLRGSLKKYDMHFKLYKQCVLLLSTGIAAGHIYYFLEDVFPQQPGGFKILKTPRFL